MSPHVLCPVIITDLSTHSQAVQWRTRKSNVSKLDQGAIEVSDKGDAGVASGFALLKPGTCLNVILKTLVCMWLFANNQKHSDAHTQIFSYTCAWYRWWQRMLTRRWACGVDWHADVVCITVHFPTGVSPCLYGAAEAGRTRDSQTKTNQQVYFVCRPAGVTLCVFISCSDLCVGIRLTLIGFGHSPKTNHLLTETKGWNLTDTCWTSWNPHPGMWPLCPTRHNPKP